MTENSSLLGYFFQSSPVVKLVLFILIIASIAAWTCILQRYFFYKRLSSTMDAFEKSIWQENDLGKLFTMLKQGLPFVAGLEYVFMAGFKEFLKVRKFASGDREFIMINVDRAMQVEDSQEAVKLEKHLSFLATVGSVSPYVGLFGTVWGIMMAFQSLSAAEQVTIAMVAPGIAEALIATAVGLFAAIPAVIAYNRYTHKVNGLLARYERFQERLSLLLSQALYAEQETSDDA